MILSIVIPVYQVEKYVEKCLRSCEAQDIASTGYELIVVNDGSKDNSLDIIQSVARDYGNIKVYTKDNSGLSATRNYGLSLAKGDFVWFIDSDDWIETNCLGRIVEKLQPDVDICQLTYRKAYDDSSKNVDIHSKNINGDMTGKEVTLKGGLHAPAQFCIYRRQFLIENELLFVPGIFHEDIEYKPRAVYLAKKIVLDDVVSYNYYQRTSGSITSSFSIKRAESYIAANNSLYRFSEGLESLYRRAFYRRISLNMNSLFYEYHNLNDIDKPKVVEILKQNRHLLGCMLKTRNVKYSLEGILFLISIPLGFRFYQVLKF